MTQQFMSPPFFIIARFCRRQIFNIAQSESYKLQIYPLCLSSQAFAYQHVAAGFSPLTFA